MTTIRIFIGVENRLSLGYVTSIPVGFSRYSHRRFIASTEAFVFLFMIGSPYGVISYLSGKKYISIKYQHFTIFCLIIQALINQD